MIEWRGNKGSKEPRDGALGVGAAVAALAFGIVVGVLSAALGSLLWAGSISALMLMVEVGLLAGTLLYLSVTGRRIGRTLRLRAVSSRIYVVAIQLGFALLLANFAATSLLGPPGYDFELPAGSEGLAERLIFAVAVVVIAPIVEESLFRGLLQGALEARMRVWYSGLPR